VVASGRHESGLVGFRLDNGKIPKLASRSRLTIRDRRSGLLVYRRKPDDESNKQKIFRLETQIVPLTRLDQACGRHFQYELLSIERFGHETALQAFHLHGVKSIYLSGRLLVRNYEEFLDKGFQMTTLLPDPYYAMAVRIFLFRKMATSNFSFLSERDKLLLGPISAHFSEVDINSTAELRRALKILPKGARNPLASPVTRQLVATHPEQKIGTGDLAAAIDLLSRFAVVGHDAELMSFQSSLAALLNLPVDHLVVPPPNSILNDLAGQLRLLPIAEQILEEDLILNHYVLEAIKSAQRAVVPATEDV